MYDYYSGMSGMNMAQCQVVRVNGENGANAYRMPPNSSVLLLDESAPIVWLKQTDGAGYASLTPYEIRPYQPAPPVDMQDVINRLERLEAEINGQKSNASATKRKSAEQDA